MEGWRKAVAPWGTWSCGVTEKYDGSVCARACVCWCVCSVDLKSCWLAFGTVFRVCYVQGSAWKKKIPLSCCKQFSVFGLLLSTSGFLNNFVSTVRTVQMNVVNIKSCRMYSQVHPVRFWTHRGLSILHSSHHVCLNLILLDCCLLSPLT